MAPRLLEVNLALPSSIARDFKEFIRIAGMTHVRTAPYYPQSNGKIERWHKSLKSEFICAGTSLTPADMMAGRREIHAARDHKLEATRRQRQLCRRSR